MRCGSVTAKGTGRFAAFLGVGIMPLLISGRGSRLAACEFKYRRGKTMPIQKVSRRRRHALHELFFRPGRISQFGVGYKLMHEIRDMRRMIKVPHTTAK